MSSYANGSPRTCRFAAAMGCVAVLAFAHVAHAGTGKNSIKSVDASEANGKTTVQIRGTRTPTFTVYKLSRPERVVIDVANAQLTGADASPTWSVNSWAVGQVAAHAKSSKDGSGVRVVVGLARKATYKVSARGNDVVVIVTPREKKPAGNDEQINARLLQAESSAREARADADKARAEAVSAKRLARERTQQVLERARAQAQKAKQQVAEARAAAKAAQQQAQQRDAEAQRQVSEAKKMIAQANSRVDKAKKIEQAAAAEAKQAAVREKAAKQAEARAGKQRAEAEQAAAKARKLEQRAAKSQDDESLRAQAQAATQKAEQRRARAEQAAAEAERARQQAETLAKNAELRRSEAMAAVNAAERQREKAEQSRRLAAEALSVAEQRRTEAESAANAASKRAAALKRAAREAEQRATKARELRVREEGAYAAAAAKRKAADEQRVAALAVAEKVKESLSAAKEAERLADQRRVEAEGAAKRAELLAKQKSASSTEIEKARATARQLEQQLARAERDLAARKGELESNEARASKIEKDRKRAIAELSTMKKKADSARARREKEERALAALEAKRVTAERDLERARKARLAAEQKLRDAEVTRSKSARKARETSSRAVADAEKQLQEARTARAEADRKLDEESRARAEAERRAERAEAAMVKTRAEAEGRAERAEAAMRAARAEAKAAEAKAAEAKLAEARAAQSAQANAAEAKTAQAAAARARAAEAKAAKTARVAQARAAKARSARAKADDSKGPRLSDVDFKDRDDSARIVIALSAPAKPKVIRQKGKRAILEIPGVAIAASLERTLDTSRFKGPVKAVSSYRDPKNPDKVRVVVDLNHEAKGVLKRVGNTYYWDFAKPGARTARKSKRRPADKNARTSEFPAPSVAGYGASSGPITQQTVSQLRQRRKVYRGRKIDLDFKDADIHNLLRLLADVGGVNIVIPSNIQETVTVRLRNVPWDQAMEVILASKGLWYRRQGALIRIAPRKELDDEDEKEAARIAANIKAEPPEPEIFTLNYAEAGSLAGQLKPLLSPKGRLEVDNRTNSVIVNDIASHRRRIIDLMTRLDTQTPQIQIEARIVEARTSFSRSFGIQWGGRATATAAGGNSTGLVFPSDVQLAGAASDGQTPEDGVLAAPPSDFAVNLPTAIGTGVGGGLGLSLGSVGGNLSVNLRLSAAEDSGSVRIISSPKITTSNNESATIKSGTSIPISVVSANGVQTQFVPADLALTVTPKVSQRDCAVSMDINLTKNEADFANTGARGDPSILTKEAKTIILVGDGETAVIGGIYTRNTGLNYTKVPFFADLPVIGYFFKTRAENDERSEVLLFITPKITNRAYLRCEN